MSSYEKTVKAACKPKATAPKAKYLDPIIAATYSEDGAVHDVCKALAPRFREPNAVVVFKALIILHTMIRNGATDNVLSYLSQTEVLKLRNVQSGNWDGYKAPENLTNYSIYLNARVVAYRELKHDPIRVQLESNRDHRMGVEDSSRGGGSGGSGVQRSKTIMGRKLRVMTVEKGLLRETKIVQKIMSVLLDCRFYLDNLEDELTISALRMLVKDLLVLFQACNEGVINVLEHYFEMSHVDATTALSIYRQFCKQTERVVEYLGIARKLENLLNVQIPNLKHAPVSLAGALEEYLTDANFEQNRIEYKTQKELAEKNKKSGKGVLKKSEQAKKAEAPKPEPSTSSAPAPPTASTSAPKKTDELQDFFESIEQSQSSMFGNQANGAVAPAVVQQAPNPFAAFQASMATGMNPFPLATQPTGFIAPQPTAFPAFMQQQQPPQPNPFSAFPALQAQMTGMPTSSSSPFLTAPNAGNTNGAPFLRPQSAAGLLQPQATGANPFRQSMFGLNPQPTGTPFGPSTAPFVQQPRAVSTPHSAGPTAAPFSINTSIPSAPNTDTNSNIFANFAAPNPTNAANGETKPTPSAIAAPFVRPASTPIGGSTNPLKPQTTGSRNPFGRPKSPPPPPVPPVPTLGQLALGSFGSKPSEAPSPFGSFTATAPATSSPTGLPQSSSSPFGGMSSIASAFTLNKEKPEGAASTPTGLGNSLFGGSLASSLSPQTTSTSSNTNLTSSLFSLNITGDTTTSTAPSSIQPQPTGFAGSRITPFKPSSSFGASLLGSLPEVPQASQPPPVTAPSNPVPANPAPATASTLSTTSTTTTSSIPAFNLFGSQPTGALNANPSAAPSAPSTNLTASASLNFLQPQATGANPFRASMFGGPAAPGAGAAASPSPFSSLSAFSSPSTTSAPGATGGTPFGSSLLPKPTGFGSSPFGTTPFGGIGSTSPFGSAFNPGQQQQQPQAQPTQHGSLI